MTIDDGLVMYDVQRLAVTTMRLPFFFEVLEKRVAAFRSERADIASEGKNKKKGKACSSVFVDVNREGFCLSVWLL